MADNDEMTPAKWGMIGGAAVVILLAIGLIYHFSQGPAVPDIKTVGDKPTLLREATGPGDAPPAVSKPAVAVEEEPQSLKGKAGKGAVSP